MHSEAATGSPSIFGKRSQIPLLLLTSTHEHCRPAMTNVQAFPLPTGRLPNPHPTHSPPAHPLLASARTPATGWPGRSWPGCRPGSLACCPGSGPCQVSDSISRPFLLRELNILSLHPSQVLPGCLVGSKKTSRGGAGGCSQTHQAGQGGGRLQKDHLSNLSPTSQ